MVDAQAYDKRPGSQPGTVGGLPLIPTPASLLLTFKTHGRINLSLVLSCSNHKNFLDPEFRDHYRSGRSEVPRPHTAGACAGTVARYLLVIYDVLAGCGDDIAGCGGHDGLDRGHQPRKTEGGAEITCVPLFLLLLVQTTVSVFWKRVPPQDPASASC